MSIRIVLADDHALLRQGIKRTLSFEEDMEIVGEAADGEEALARTLILQPNILLLDLNMPGLSGLEILHQLQATRSKTKVIALTIHDSDNYVLEMLNNGVAGYILKEVEPPTLVKAIRSVNAGAIYIYPLLAERIFGGLQEGETFKEKAREIWRQHRSERLTTRELDVLSCIAKGLSNQDIAKALFVSEKTVKNHLTNIFKKIHVNDRTQALIYILKHKMMSLD